MNIEQKNTLFVVSLVMAVLVAVSGVVFLLVRDHVATSIEADLERARKVFVQSRVNSFDTLLTMARSMRDEPSLIAATLTGDIATVRGMLDDLYPRPGVDFVAVYLDNGPGGVAGAGNKPHYTSRRILSSQELQGLVRRLAQGESVVFGNVLLYDSLLQLVTVPIENPLGGRVGALLVGRHFDQKDAEAVRQLVYADVTVFSDTQLLASSLDNIQPQLHRFTGRAASDASFTFDVDGRRYTGRLQPIRYQPGKGDSVVDVLLSVDHAAYWAPYRILGENALYFSLLILLTAVLLGISISRRTLTRPIQLLAHATRAIAGGDLNINVPGRRRDELGQLTESFNSMLGTLKASREDLEQSRQRFRDFASSSSDWLWETDRSGRFSYVSETVSNTLEVPAERWLGKNPAELFPGSTLGELMSLLRPGNAEPAGFKDVEIWLRSPLGEQHCLRLNAVPIMADGEFTGFRGTARDITKIKHDERRMVVLANQDHLTGLFNRRRFLQDLQHEILRVQRNGQVGVLLLIDLDHLKLVNDTAGHAVGDQIIVQVAGYLKRASREQDLLARISGDEFAIACSAMNEEQGIEKAQKILERITALKPVYAGRTLNVTASIGVVTFPHQGKVPVELLAKADAAMSSAKAAGRNRVHRYNEGDMTRERMDNQLVWKDRLLEALEKDALKLVFQPIVALSSSRTHHYEVLVRMQESDGTLIAPGMFIPAAEQFGFIQKVDCWVLSRAIRYLAELPAELDSVGFSINLSGMSVGHKGMYELIQREVREAGVDPARITFEITETAACEQLNTAIEFISKVRSLGCQISLDDFGVGFSSFSYLKHLHADLLKIDGSFIRDIHNSKSDQLFVKALVDVARGMGMRTIAEFVENEQVFRRVMSLGVDYVQGYYLGKPSADLVAESVSQPALAASARVLKSVG